MFTKTRSELVTFGYIHSHLTYYIPKEISKKIILFLDETLYWTISHTELQHLLHTQSKFCICSPSLYINDIEFYFQLYPKSGRNTSFSNVHFMYKLCVKHNRKSSLIKVYYEFLFQNIMINWKFVHTFYRKQYTSFPMVGYRRQHYEEKTDHTQNIYSLNDDWDKFLINDKHIKTLSLGFYVNILSNEKKNTKIPIKCAYEWNVNAKKYRNQQIITSDFFGYNLTNNWFLKLEYNKTCGKKNYGSKTSIENAYILRDVSEEYELHLISLGLPKRIQSVTMKIHFTVKEKNNKEIFCNGELHGTINDSIGYITICNISLQTFKTKELVVLVDMEIEAVNTGTQCISKHKWSQYNIMGCNINNKIDIRLKRSEFLNKLKY
eukprot:281973_1